MSDNASIWNVLRWYSEDHSLGSITSVFNGITFGEAVSVRRGLALEGRRDVAIVRDDTLWQHMTRNLDIFQPFEGGGPCCVRGLWSIGRSYDPNICTTPIALLHLRLEPNDAHAAPCEPFTRSKVCRQPS